MSESRPVEIACPACKGDSLLLREPRYEGFTRVGETLSCSACGHVFAEEADVPYKRQARVHVFTEEDRPAPVDVFAENEAERMCHRCTHYVVNPFMQWCGLHRREVEATDTCDRFERKPDEADNEDAGDESGPPQFT
jgi:hypothetical protein